MAELQLRQPGHRSRIACHLQRDLVRSEKIVRIEILDDLALREPQRVIARRAGAAGSCRTTRQREEANRRASSKLPSVEPSSTTITSTRGHVWSSAERERLRPAMARRCGTE